jgi:hypothetical protein
VPSPRPPQPAWRRSWMGGRPQRSWPPRRPGDGTRLAVEEHIRYSPQRRSGMNRKEPRDSRDVQRQRLYDAENRVSEGRAWDSLVAAQHYVDELLASPWWHRHVPSVRCVVLFDRGARRLAAGTPLRRAPRAGAGVRGATPPLVCAAPPGCGAPGQRRAGISGARHPASLNGIDQAGCAGLSAAVNPRLPLPSARGVPVARMAALPTSVEALVRP